MSKAKEDGPVEVRVPSSNGTIWVYVASTREEAQRHADDPNVGPTFIEEPGP